MKKKLMVLLVVLMTALISASPIYAKHNTNPHPGTPPGWGDPDGGHGPIGPMLP